MYDKNPPENGGFVSNLNGDTIMYLRLSQTADKVKVSGQIFCKKPFQITQNMV